MLRVRDRVADHALKEKFEHTTGLVVNQTRNTLDSATTCKTSDRRLGDTLDVVAQNFAMAFSAALSKSFATLPR